jgi:hypothetical protein
MGRGWLAVLLPAGFAFGLIAGFLQESTVTLGSVTIPWAAVLLVVTLVAVVRAVSLNMETRLAGGLFYLGWAIATGMMALPNPSGDVVFTQDAYALGYLMTACVLGAAAAAWPLFLGEGSSDTTADLVAPLPGTDYE